MTFLTIFGLRKRYYCISSTFCRIQICATFFALRMESRNRQSLKASHRPLQVHCWVSLWNSRSKEKSLRSTPVLLFALLLDTTKETDRNGPWSQRWCHMMTNWLWHKVSQNALTTGCAGIVCAQCVSWGVRHQSWASLWEHWVWRWCWRDWWRSLEPRKWRKMRTREEGCSLSLSEWVSDCSIWCYISFSEYSHANVETLN